MDRGKSIFIARQSSNDYFLVQQCTLKFRVDLAHLEIVLNMRVPFFAVLFLSSKYSAKILVIHARLVGVSTVPTKLARSSPRCSPTD